jgi:hypothetical protein
MFVVTMPGGHRKTRAIGALVALRQMGRNFA